MPQLDRDETRRTLATAAVLGLACAVFGPLSWAQIVEPHGHQAMTPLYKRATAPVEERVADLLSRMTIDEKLAQLDGRGVVALRAARVDKQKRGAVSPSRPGIPVLFYEEALPHPADQAASGFPQPIALASTWDAALVREVNSALAAELSANGVRLFMGPVLDVTRDARRGRVEETFGEDPYLVGVMGVAAIEGLQGTKPALAPGKVLAAAPHLAGHGLPGKDTEVGPAPLSERELRDNFFPPFEVAIRKAGLGAIVASRGEIDGVPSHASPWLLQEVLRKEWGFGGVVFADARGVDELKSLYQVAATPADGAALALGAGIDAEGAPGESYAALAEGVRTGRVLLTRIDAAVARILALKFRAGLFDLPAVDTAKAPGKAAAGALALKAAQRSITLLKNDGVLPLAAGKSRMMIALVESGGASISGGLRARLRGRADLLMVKATALDAAKSADRIVLVIGDAGNESQERLAAVKALGKPLVVVLAGNRPGASVQVSEAANALLGAWGLGEQGGKAVADVLFGDVNPGGKLAVTIARNAGQLPMFYNVKPSARRGYLFETSDPLYPFGWGLAYTTFEVGAPRLSSATMGAEGSVQVSIDVRNSGPRAGDETVQLYIRDKVSSVTRPVQELKGFQRVSLAAGESRTLDFTLAAQSLAMWDGRMRRVVEPGEFEIMAGSHSAQLRSVTLTVTGGPAK